MPQPAIESVACSVADAVAAERCGVDRIELCSAIELGGITPSIGLCKEVLARVSIPVMAMVRPRAGDFCYSDSELTTMERDAEALLATGVHGLVFGILDSEQRVDFHANERLIRLTSGREAVFHRAFDVTRDPLQALDTLMELGFTRLLTSGQKETALEGAALIRELETRAANRLQVMAGGGIRGANMVEVLERANVAQVHLGAFQRVGEGGRLYSEGYLALDEEALRHAVERFRSQLGPSP